MNKPYHIFKALTDAIDDYNARNDQTRHDIALEVGYKGSNAGVQLNSALNVNSDKALTHEREFRILAALDDDARELYFRARLREWSLEIRPRTAFTLRITNQHFHQVADEAMMEGDDVFKEIKMSLSDQELTVKELKHIRKEAVEAKRKYEEVIDMCDARIRKEEMGE